MTFWEIIAVCVGVPALILFLPTCGLIAIELEKRKVLKFLHYSTINTYVTNYLVHSDKWHYYSDQANKIEAEIDSFVENRRYLPKEEILKKEESIRELQKEYVKVREDFNYHGNEMQKLYELLLKKLVELGIKEEEVTNFIKLLFEYARLGN